MPFSPLATWCHMLGSTGGKGKLLFSDLGVVCSGNQNQTNKFQTLKQKKQTPYKVYIHRQLPGFIKSKPSTTSMNLNILRPPYGKNTFQLCPFHVILWSIPCTSLVWGLIHNPAVWPVMTWIVPILAWVQFFVQSKASAPHHENKILRSLLRCWHQF